MELQNRLAARKVGKLDMHTPVKTAGTQQGRIERLGAVRRAQHDDALVVVETVHLGKQLVERLLALVIGRKASGVAALADGVDLVDEDDAGGLFLGLLEQVAHTSRAAAHEHLDKLRAGNGEERHLCLAGNSLGEQRLARAGRAHKQGSARQLCADFLIALGTVEEVDDLGQGLLGLVLTGDVVERDARLLLGDNLRVGSAQTLAETAEAHRGVVVAHGLAQLLVHPPTESNEDDDRQEEGEQVDEHAAVVDLDVGGRRGARLLKTRQQRGVVGPVRGAVIARGTVIRLGAVLDLTGGQVVLDLVDLALISHGEQLRVGNLLHGVHVDGRRHHGVEHGKHDQTYEDIGDHSSALFAFVHIHKAKAPPQSLCVSVPLYPAGESKRPPSSNPHS